MKTKKKKKSAIYAYFTQDSILKREILTNTNIIQKCDGVDNQYCKYNISASFKMMYIKVNDSSKTISWPIMQFKPLFIATPSYSYFF